MSKPPVNHFVARETPTTLQDCCVSQCCHNNMHLATIEMFVLEGLAILCGAAVRVIIAKWKTFRSQKSTHEALHFGEKSVVL